ncbi:Aspartic protease [Trichinella spiralis]|uniref:Aspartic protease n=1 Tax=Trichinella spiralis TaxID=6334 RepID=A0ABR3KYA5_TRISP
MLRFCLKKCLATFTTERYKYLKNASGRNNQHRTSARGETRSKFAKYQSSFRRFDTTDNNGERYGITGKRNYW